MINPAASTEKVRASRRRRRRFRRRLRRGAEIGFLLAIIILIASVLLRHSATSNTTKTTVTTTALTPLTGDAKLGRCGYSNYAATAPVSITNHTTLVMSYAVTVVWTDKGKVFATSTVTADNVHAGDVRQLLATGVSTHPDPTDLGCRIYFMRRFQ